MLVGFKINQLVCDLALVVGVLLWEILNFLTLAPWQDDNFNFDVCVDMIDSSKYAVSSRIAASVSGEQDSDSATFLRSSQTLFLKRLVGEMEKIINRINLVVISAQHTVILYKILSLIRFVALSSKKTRVFKACLQQDYQEEFK